MHAWRFRVSARPRSQRFFILKTLAATVGARSAVDASTCRHRRSNRESYALVAWGVAITNVLIDGTLTQAVPSGEVMHELAEHVVVLCVAIIMRWAAKKSRET